MGQWRSHWLQAVVRLAEQAEPRLANCTNKEQEIVENNMTKNESTTHLAVIPHRSDLKFISSCNCGRQQAQRLDPFDYREANWEFYNSLEFNCCSKVGGRFFPIL